MFMLLDGLLGPQSSTINVPDNSGCTPLLHAVNNQRFDVARMLVQAGASLDVRRLVSLPPPQPYQTFSNPNPNPNPNAT